MARKLSPEEIQQQLPNFAQWSFDPEQQRLNTGFEFQDFDQAVDFILLLRDLANTVGHHPDVYISNYKFVDVSLHTHDMQGISDQDFELAGLIDQVFSQSIANQAQPQQDGQPPADNQTNIVQQVINNFRSNRPEQQPAQPQPVTAAVPAPTAQQPVQPQLQQAQNISTVPQASNQQQSSPANPSPAPTQREDVISDQQQPTSATTQPKNPNTIAPGPGISEQEAAQLAAQQQKPQSPPPVTADQPVAANKPVSPGAAPVIPPKGE